MEPAKEAITKIVKGKSDPLKEFEEYLSKNPWPIGYPKSNVDNTIKHLLEGTLPHDPANSLMDYVAGIERKPIPISDSQRELLRRMLKLTKEAKKQECNHENLVIAAFASGGGFFPVTVLPEVICLDCGLNVTVYAPKDYIKFKKEFGLAGGRKVFRKLHKWAAGCQKDGSVPWVDDVPGNAVAEYHKNPNKWMKAIPFKIVNKEAFESKSGR